MSAKFFPGVGANSVPLHPLAGFEGPFEVGEDRGKRRKAGERKGRKGTKGAGENTPTPT